MMNLKLLFESLKRYAKTAYKVAVIVLVCLVVMNVFLYFINKNRPSMAYDPVTDMRRDIYKTINNPALKKSDVGKTVIGLYRLSLCGMVGEGCTNNPADGDKNYNGSFFGRLTSAVTIPYANPPASGIYWVHATLEHAGFVPKSYAAEGIGFAALKPLLGLWKMFRDLAFSVLVIYLIVSGLLIMFRFKINPQTVITIENSLPRVFISLLVITFSFAIAGLLIDLMYVVSALAISIVGGYSPKGNGEPYISLQQQATFVTQGGIMRLMDDVFFNLNIIKLGWDIFTVAPMAVNILLRAVVSFITIMLIRSTPLGDLFNGNIAWLPDWAAGLTKFFFGGTVWLIALPVLAIIGPILLGLLLMFTTGLYVFIRILALLFSAYLRILINTLFAPLILLAGVLPGRSILGNWVKTLLADLVVFPIVMVMIVLAGVMAKVPVEDGSFWQPPFLFSSLNPQAFRAIISIGVLFLIPQVVKSIRGLLGIKPTGFNFGAGLFAAGLVGVGGGGLGALSKYGSISHGLSGLSGLPGGLGRTFAKLGGKGHAGAPAGAAHAGRWGQRWTNLKTANVAKKLSSSGPSNP